MGKKGASVNNETYVNGMSYLHLDKDKFYRFLSASDISLEKCATLVSANTGKTVKARTLRHYLNEGKMPLEMGLMVCEAFGSSVKTMLGERAEMDVYSYFRRISRCLDRKS